MEISAQYIAQLVNGTIEGDPSAAITSFAPIEEAEAGSISFVANLKYLNFLYETKAAVVLIPRTLVIDKEVQPTLIRVDDVYLTLSVLLDAFSEQQSTAKTGIEQPSFIHPSANIAPDAYIGAFAYIGANVTIAEGAQIYPHAYIGDNTTINSKSVIYSGAKLYANTMVGKHVIIHSGAVIGADGFGFAPDKDGSYKKIPQQGKVIIGDHVEIGANTCIDRATLKATIIGAGSKLDNLIQIAHNVELGVNTAIAAQAGISGSTKVGEQSQVGGQVGIVGHITIAPGTQIAAQSGVAKAITVEGQKWFGSPAKPYKEALKFEFLVKSLPKFEERLKRLELLQNDNSRTNHEH